MARRAPNAQISGEYERPSLSFDDVVTLHEGEWVLWEVTALEGGWPSHGRVLAHSPSRAAIMAAWANAKGARTQPGQHYVFRACEAITTGAELREALEALQATWDGEIESAW